MADNILVSVIMITYNHEDYIRQAVESVFMQKTNFDYELIIGEDCSTDNTRAVILELKEKYGDRIVLVLHDKNVGVRANSDSVRKLRRGKYSATLEGDNFWTDEYKLQKQVDYLEMHPSVAAVAHDYAVVFADGRISNDAKLRLKKDFVWGWKDFLRNGLTMRASAIMVRIDLFPVKDEKYIALRCTAPTMGDVITFAICCHNGGVYVMHDVMAAIRMPAKKDTASFSFSQQTKMIEYSYMYIDIVHALEKYFDGKYDLSPLIANRLTGVLGIKLLHPTRLRTKDVMTIMCTVPLKVRLLAVGKTIRRTIRDFCKGVINRIRKKIKGEVRI